MKTLTIACLMLASFAAHAQTRVDGYFRKDGTYVAPHVRSAPDSSRINNYNAQNSIYDSNPYTGERGSQRDELSPQPAYNRPREPQRTCSTDLYGRRVCY